MHLSIVSILVALLGSTLAAPAVMVLPGDVTDIIITNEEIVNATRFPSLESSSEGVAVADSKLPLSLVNNFAGTDAINVYVTGQDRTTKSMVLQPDGTWLYPPCQQSGGSEDISVNVVVQLGPRGSTTGVTLPGSISGARIWSAAGELNIPITCSGGTPGLVQASIANPADPNAAINWGFVELTYTAGNEGTDLWVNLSYVDFVGLVLGASITGGDGSTQSAKGLQPSAVSTICSDLAIQGTKDGQPWGDLCQLDPKGTPLRVVAPFDYITVTPGAFGDYFTDYVNDVWTTFTDSPLTVDTQSSGGRVECRVQGDYLICDGDEKTFSRHMTAGDIFACAGQFSGGDSGLHSTIATRLCAALNRATFLATGGNIQPNLGPNSYCPSVANVPMNWYSAIVHKYEVDGIGYAFPHDDVNPTSGDDQSGLLHNTNPQSLTVFVGGSSPN